jgi:ribosomal protein S18 acetylase RimI-like enzyme
LTGPDVFSERVVVTTARLTPAHHDQLVALFAEIAKDATSARFHPHPFTAEQAYAIAAYQGEDLYLGLFLDGLLCGYGMLRGWEAGYVVPSLGIYVAPNARGKGYSRAFMRALHDAAGQRGARCVRLKVYPDNLRALRLYERLGYIFDSEDGVQRIGLLSL